jgi:Fur family peroxide stress response transcriptional regulator
MNHTRGTIQEKVAHFEQACDEAGLKMTHQRMEIFRELASSTDHPSAETLYKRLRSSLATLSLDTVYRTLATFEKHDLISRVQTVESQARFEAEMVQHHHVICHNCGEITDFRWETFDATRLPGEIARWGRIENKKVTLHGICEKCACEKV